MTAPEVLVIGEALVDVVKQGDTVTEHPGGSAANVALGLGRLGVDVELLTHLGRDAHGHAVVTHLERSGVRVRPESMTTGRTSTAVATIGSDGAAQYEFDVSWEFTAAEPAQAAIMHIGSFAAFLTEPDRLLRYREACGATEVSIDPNVRPALAGDHGEALRRFEAVTGVCTIVKLSDEDAEWLYPERNPDEVIDGLLEAGAHLTALTLGARGLMLATPAHRLTVPAVRAQAVDTIGAGDTVMASLLASIRGVPSANLDAMALQRLGEDAVRAASITVTRAGADLPWAADLS